MYTLVENCVDRHAEEYPERVAIIWERDEAGDAQYITYRSVDVQYVVLLPFQFVTLNNV